MWRRRHATTTTYNNNKLDQIGQRPVWQTTWFLCEQSIAFHLTLATTQSLSEFGWSGKSPPSRNLLNNNTSPSMHQVHKITWHQHQYHCRHCSRATVVVVVTAAVAVVSLLRPGAHNRIETKTDRMCWKGRRTYKRDECSYIGLQKGPK